MKNAALFFLLLVSGIGTIHAHRFEITEVDLVVEIDGHVKAWMQVDVDALALGVSPDSDDAANVSEIQARDDAETLLDSARRVLLRRVRIRFDEEKSMPSIEFPEWSRPSTDPLFPTVFGSVARFDTEIPVDGKTLTFTASRAFGPVRLSIREAATGRVRKELLSPGEGSAPFVFGESGVEESDESWSRYARLGFLHIVPYGFDHILFVLGLFLLGRRWKALLLQVSAFTVAHTMTLALSIYGVVALPSRWVEVLIALSIVYVAVENLLTDRVQSWRLALVFGFGLLHGLGFAGALRELGLGKDRFLVSLISFNVGVEFGQLAVILVAFVLVGRYRRLPWYRPRIVVPVSLMIAAVALFWTVQ
ncbi:MAG: HupE/UreJ family protein, partial [Acidobacteriota bacterium]|nr:HupE/UreJ family protein [Acidobacteriota bacterium]